MRRLHIGLVWLVVAALAFAAVLAFNPGPAGAQSPGDEDSSGCETTLLNFPPKPGVAPIANLQRANLKNIDLAIVSNTNGQGDPDPNWGPGSARILGKLTAGNPIRLKQPVVTVDSLQAAIDAINNAYNANNQRKLNVIIVGHGAPGWINIGKWDPANRIGSGQAPANQNLFINGNGMPGKAGQGAKDKIEHLKFISCSTGAGNVGQAFLDKLRRMLNAGRVEGFTNTVIAAGVVPFTNYPNSPNMFLIVVKPGDPPDGKKVGGIVVDQDLGGLALQSDSSSSSDAWLLTGIALATASAITLGGGVWYARRRRMR